MTDAARLIRQWRIGMADPDHPIAKSQRIRPAAKLAEAIAGFGKLHRMFGNDVEQHVVVPLREKPRPQNPEGRKAMDEKQGAIDDIGHPVLARCEAFGWDQGDPALLGRDIKPVDEAMIGREGERRAAWAVTPLKGARVFAAADGDFPVHENGIVFPGLRGVGDMAGKGASPVPVIMGVAFEQQVLDTTGRPLDDLDLPDHGVKLDHVLQGLPCCTLYVLGGAASSCNPVWAAMPFRHGPGQGLHAAFRFKTGPCGKKLRLSSTFCA